MNRENLQLARNILFRLFVVGIVITCILAGATIGWWETWTRLASTWFHTDVAVMTPLVIEFFMGVRFFLLYVVLAPALALHWTLQSDMIDFE